MSAENPYLRRIRVSNGPDKGKLFQCDIYDIIKAFGVTNVGQIQAIKKILRGGRSDKTWKKDMGEGIQSLQRAIEINEGEETDNCPL